MTSLSNTACSSLPMSHHALRTHGSSRHSYSSPHALCYAHSAIYPEPYHQHQYFTMATLSPPGPAAWKQWQAFISWMHLTHNTMQLQRPLKDWLPSYQQDYQWGWQFCPCTNILFQYSDHQWWAYLPAQHYPTHIGYCHQCSPTSTPLNTVPGSYSCPVHAQNPYPTLCLDHGYYINATNYQLATIPLTHHTASNLGRPLVVDVIQPHAHTDTGLSIRQYSTSNSFNWSVMQPYTLPDMACVHGSFGHPAQSGVVKAMFLDPLQTCILD